jgi:hypothetical protein
VLDELEEAQGQRLVRIDGIDAVKKLHTTSIPRPTQPPVGPAVGG